MATLTGLLTPSAGVITLEALQDAVIRVAGIHPFPSRADVTTTDIDADIDVIRTAGYAAAGDGGGGMYLRSAVEPSHEGKVQSNDGAWWELFADSGQVTSKAFGTATTALTNALAFAVAKSGKVVMTGDFTSDLITTTTAGNRQLDLNGRTVTAASGFYAHTDGSGILTGYMKNGTITGGGTGTAFNVLGAFDKFELADLYLHDFAQGVVIGNNNAGTTTQEDRLQFRFRRSDIESISGTNASGTIYGVLHYSKNAVLEDITVDGVVNSGTGSGAEATAFYGKAWSGRFTRCTARGVAVGAGGVLYGMRAKGATLGNTAPLGTGQQWTECVVEDVDGSGNPDNTYTALFEVATDHVVVDTFRGVGGLIGILFSGEVNGSTVVGHDLRGDGATTTAKAFSGNLWGTDVEIGPGTATGYAQGIVLSSSTSQTLEGVNIIGGVYTGISAAAAPGIDLYGASAGSSFSNFNIIGVTLRDFTSALRLRSVSDGLVSDCTFPDVQEPIIVDTLTNVKVLNSVRRTTTTTDASVTTPLIIGIGKDTGQLDVRVRVSARITSGTGSGEAGSWVLERTARRAGAATTMIGAVTTVHSKQDTNVAALGGPSVNAGSGSTAGKILIQVTGAAATTVEWVIEVDCFWR